MSDRKALETVGGERAERCGTCRFWEYDAEGTEWYRQGIGESKTQVGLCRLAPPVLAEMVNDFDGPAARNPLSWQQPSVKGEGWCGEWQAAKAVENPPADVLDMTIGQFFVEKTKTQQKLLRGVANFYGRTDWRDITVRDLLNMAAKDISGIHDIGPQSVLSVRLKLREYGLFLLGDHPATPTVGQSRPTEDSEGK